MNTGMPIEPNKSATSSHLADVCAALHECEQRGCLLSDNIGDVLYTLTTGLQITYVSRSVVRLLGYTPEELRHMSLERLFSPSSYRAAASLLKKVLKQNENSDEPRVLELECITKNGQRLWTEMRVTLLLGPDKKVAGLLGMMHDITRRRATELEKSRLEKRLLKTQRLETVGTLAGGIAHDFNNILTTINGYCELLLKDCAPSDPRYEDLQQIRSAAGRGERLVRQLLTFARRQQTQLVPVNVNQIIGDMLQMLDRLIGEDITIAAELASDLWTVRADPGRIEQILMNFAVNARDAMPEGGKITVRTENVTLQDSDIAAVSDARSGSFVRISVTDTGCGIDAKTKEKIFEPFFTTKREGVGMGLATVKAIAVQHKGWIAADNSPGGGAVFSVFLPAAPDIEKSENHTGRATSANHHGNHHERILLVEDDAAIRDVTLRMLLREGYRVEAAADADEALALFNQKNGDFDLLLSDVVLPGKSGLELAVSLQECKPGLRVLLASGYTDEKAQWQEIRKRGYLFLRKPFLTEELLKTIRSALQHG